MKQLAVAVTLVLSVSPAFANDGSQDDEVAPETVVITEKGHPFWAGVAISTGVLSLGLVTAASYYYVSWRGDVDSIRVSRPGQPGHIGPEDCGKPGIEDMNGVFTSLCTKRSRSLNLLIAGAALVPIVVASGYFGYVYVSKREVRRVAVVPTITPQAAGLTLDVRW